MPGRRFASSDPREARIGGVSAVAGALVCAALVLWVPGSGVPWWPVVLVSACLATVASERRDVTLGLGAEADLRLSSTPAVLLAAALLMPPPWVPVLVAVPALLAALSGRRDWPRLVTRAALDLVELASALVAAWLVSAALGSAQAAQPVALVSAGAAWWLTGAVAVSVLCRAALGIPLRLSPVLSLEAQVPAAVQAVLGVTAALVLHTSVWCVPIAALLLWVNYRYVVAISTTQDSRRDDKTGLPRHAEFVTAAQRELARAARTGQPVCMLMLDLDHFKRVNSQHGHIVGDAVLSEVGRRIASTLRLSDVAARFGGEEFSVLLPDVRGPAAVRVAERIRAAVSDQPVEVDGLRVPVTVSIGVAGHQSGEDLRATLGRADLALYRAKDRGRNAVEPLSSV